MLMEKFLGLIIVSQKVGLFFWIEEISAMLGYAVSAPNLRIYWLLPRLSLGDGLRIVQSDSETVVMKQITHKVKNFVLYFDHNNLVAKNSDDVVLDPIAVLPKVVSPSKVTHIDKTEGEKLPAFYSNLKRREDDAYDKVSGGETESEDEEDSDFVDSDYEVSDDDFDLYVDNVEEEGETSKGASKGKKSEKVGLVSYDIDGEYASTDDELELPETAEGKGLKLRIFKEEDMSNPIFKVGMLFTSVQMLRKAITEYSLKERVEIKLPRNDKRRVRAHCADRCPSNMYASFDSKANAFMVKTYCGTHNYQKEWVLKRCTSRWLAEKYVETFRADEKISLTNFGKTVQKRLEFDSFKDQALES